VLRIHSPMSNHPSPMVWRRIDLKLGVSERRELVPLRGLGDIAGHEEGKRKPRTTAVTSNRPLSRVLDPRPTGAMQQVGRVSGVRRRRYATWSQRQRITRSAAEADAGCTKPQMPADCGSALHYPWMVNAAGLTTRPNSSCFAKTRGDVAVRSAEARPSLLEGIQCIDTLCSP
jgi:hypothetical protein